MILEKQSKKFSENSSDSYVTQKQLLKLLDNQEDFRNELVNLFQIDESEVDVLQIGNSKFLVDSLFLLDSQCVKIDIKAKMKDIQLKKMLQDEKALFEIFKITNEEIIKKNKSDLLEVETAYSAKQDLLDYYSFSKFANYLRDSESEDLIDVIKKYLNQKNVDNIDSKSLRLLYKKNEDKFYLRTVTSVDNYQDFGLNFSVFVALVVLSKYVKESKNEIYIDKYVVDDSNLYISFSLSNEKKINKNLTLSFNLLLENDEIKRNAVSFNGVFKLKYNEDNKKSEIYIKPKGVKKDDVAYPVDLLTYKHTGNTKNVFEKIKELPTLIDFFISQVSNDATKISDIKNPKDVRLHLANKINSARKPEFLKYKKPVYNKLMKMTVDNTFNLFEIFREIDELFE
ncbi:MAG: hypothetical protein DCF13_07210, partial [Flavobacteriaceae bacterium]